MIIECISTSFLLVLIMILIVIFKFSLSVSNVIKKYANIPGTKQKGIRGFFLGDIPAIMEQDHAGMSLHEYLASLVPIYGKTFKFRILQNIIVFTIEPKLIKEIYIEKNFPKAKYTYSKIGYPGGERFMGDGLVTEIDHDKWKARRALFNPGFHRQILMKFMTEFNSKADILVNFLKSKADGKTEITLLDEFNHTALDIIASVAFSMNIDSVNNPKNKFNDNIYFALSNLTSFLMDPYIKYKPNKWSFLNKHRQAIKFLRDTGREQILRRIEMFKKNQELPNDILTTILKSHEENEFDLESMVDDFLTFFVGGQETTAALLSSLFLELGRNKDVLKKLKNEIDSVIGTNGEIFYDDLGKLKYTGLCIKEALRLWPPAPQFTRNSTQDIQTQDFTIPAGTRIVTSTYASSRCEEFFEDALAFKPERFLKSENDTESCTISKYIYYPYSLGPRNCIGQNFAHIEIKVIITKILQNFDFELNPNQSFSSIQAGTLRPKDGTKCYLTQRL